LPFSGVQGSARTGFIFTRIQEGTQPGGLTQPGQTEQGIPYHVLSCRVLVGGELGSGKSVKAQEPMAAAGGKSSAFHCFVLCILLICIIVVTVPFVCCSFKLPLCRPTRFLPVSFHSPPHLSGGRGGHVALLLLATAKL